MAEGSILERIVAQRRRDVADAKARRPRAAVERDAAAAPPPIDVVARLRRGGRIAVMAEIKRASPSRGDIAPDIDAAEQARRYAAGGAAVISVLTEPHWFKGSLADLQQARAAVEPFGTERPGLLRKDFIIDPYQVAEARAAGADAVLLIVACLDDATLRELLAETRAYGMEALVEVNSEAEMERAAAAGARFVGINNRNLHNFRVDLATTERLAARRPTGALLAALSGIERREDVERFALAGAEAVLVGEALMRAADPGALIREFAAVPVTG